MDILSTILVVVAGYLLGSIPSGYVLAKLVAGIDICEYGSGRTVGRT
ncbi:MAG: glycerol-3-phosphate acyltransferase [Chloroflexi bacterium]|nr:glycerol-3-phosphate acyltransferase [Chloroflexota bacterium]MBI5956319.1 glycerol-3-phosphate acyltransferase [Chloroflexota bacterium]